MVINAVNQGAGLATFQNDPRVTRVGTWLRKYRIDELPQIFNVLRGKMSLVGPRPLLPDYLDAYSARDRRRLLVKPGVTGWQQVNGGSRNTWDERITLDLWYVDNWSFWVDLKVLLLTVLVVLKSDGVYGNDGWQRSGYPTSTPHAINKRGEQ
jgi:lipopolysaccharide/colanic/teichoic acid biosynthesis glycosyltransferase